MSLWKRIKKPIAIVVEFCFSIALFVNAALFVPQIIELLRTQNAGSLSLATFLGFNLIQLAILLHGLFRKDWILVVGMILSLIACGTVTVLIVIFS